MAEEQNQGQEKTEAPTAKRRDEARKEGNVATSRELSSAALLGSFALYFMVAGQMSVDRMKTIFLHAFNNLFIDDLSPQVLSGVLFDVLMGVLPAVIGIFGLVVIVGFLASFMQVGPMLNGIKFQANRINPLSGLKRIFSTQGLMELFKSLFKLSMIGLIGYFTLEDEVMAILALSKLSIFDILSYNFSLLGELFGKVALALVALAVLDYLYQRWQLEQRLKMTKQELKEELKQTEGDPLLRSRVRQIQRDMSQARMMENVPKADVVVTNPTHFAVALEYDREVMSAPRLVAKGADYLAARIREIARENDVPLVENPAVAREIYAQVEVGEEIPEEFFRAVAEILAYVYRLKGKDVEATE